LIKRILAKVTADLVGLENSGLYSSAKKSWLKDEHAIAHFSQDCDRFRLSLCQQMGQGYPRTTTTTPSLDFPQMLEFHKNYLLDENQQAIAVQIPITEFEQIEEILENYGLVQLMESPEDNERLHKNEAQKYYQMLSG
jgi:RelB Antitoxin alpha helical domain